MHKPSLIFRLRPIGQLASAGALLSLGLMTGCGSSDSGGADAASQVTYDASATDAAATADANTELDAATADAATADANTELDAAIEPDAAQPAGSQRALWFGDFTTNGVDEVRMYDGATGLSSFTIGGVTVINSIQSLAVSPDGTRVAIGLKHDGGTPILYVVNIDGTGTPITILATGNAAVTFSTIVWSPDGTQLAYISDTLLNGQKLVFAAPADGSSAPKLVSQSPGNADQEAQTLAWAGNSTVVYRADYVVDQVDNFFSSDVTLTVPAPISLVPDNLLSDKAEVRNTAEFAGGKVYFKSNHEGTYKLYRVDPDGANLETIPQLAALTNGSGAAQGGTFAISPDGASIAFSADSPTAFLYQVYVASLDGPATLQSNAAVSNPTPTSTRGPVGPEAIQWSADGAMLGVIADWPVGTGDLDGDDAGFIIPASGAAGGVRIWNVGTPSSNQEVAELAFTSDSSALFALGDLRSDNNIEVYLTTDLTTADQDTATTLIQGVPNSGDVYGLEIIP